MSRTIPMYMGTIPYVTTEQMIEVDRAMVEDVHIELIQMMENAGRHLAHLARMRFFDGNPRVRINWISYSACRCLSPRPKRSIRRKARP